MGFVWCDDGFRHIFGRKFNRPFYSARRRSENVSVQVFPFCWVRIFIGNVRLDVCVIFQEFKGTSTFFKIHQWKRQTCLLLKVAGFFGLVAAAVLVVLAISHDELAMKDNGKYEKIFRIFFIFSSYPFWIGLRKVLHSATSLKQSIWAIIYIRFPFYLLDNWWFKCQHLHRTWKYW